MATANLRLKSPPEPDPPEAWHQEMVLRLAELNKAAHPELGDLFHVPNGGFREKSTAAALTRQGVKSGVPDLVLPHARGGWFGLWIEMKRFREGSPSDAQKEWLARLQAAGYRAVLCKGWRMAWDEITRYLALPATAPVQTPPPYSPLPHRR